MKQVFVILGAGFDQLPMIRRAREMGLSTYVFDQDKNAPGVKEADYFANVSTRDVLGIIQQIQYHKDIVGVCTMGSNIPEEVNDVAAYFDCPRTGKDVALLGANKLLQKERLQAAGIPTPWFAEVKTAQQLYDILRSSHKQMLIKPIDRSGARGVQFVDERGPYEEAFNLAKELSYSGRVMVEEFVAGRQYSVETVLSGFGAQSFTAQRIYEGRLIESGAKMPVPKDIRISVEPLAERAAAALGIKDWTAKADIVIGKKGPQVIEMHARLSGEEFAGTLIPESTGVDIVRAAIQLALGEPVFIEGLQPDKYLEVETRWEIPEGCQSHADRRGMQVIKEAPDSMSD